MAVSSAWRRLSPASRLIFVAVAVLVSYILYARRHFYRDPGSVFYDHTRAFERDYSAIREAEAASFIRNAEVALAPVDTAGSNPLLCATFVTMRRDVERQYILNAIGSALANLTVAERRAIFIGVLFADTEPNRNPAYRDSALSNLVDRIYSIVDLPDSDQEYVLGLETSKARLEKGTYDYTRALQNCIDLTQAPYVAVFEDDILLANSWLSRTLSGLHDGEEMMAREYGDAGKWLYMRLFNQERSTGWSSQKIGGNHELPIAAGISVVAWFAMAFARRRPYFRSSLPPSVIAIVCLAIIPIAVVLFFQSGKASLWPPSAGVRDEFYGCCSQAMVFNRAHVQKLINFLKEYQWAQYDMVTRDFAYNEGLRRLSQYPMMAQHIGLKSATSTTAEEAQAVWGMAFEYLDAGRLDRDHRNFVQQIFGNDAVGKDLLHG